MAVAGGHAVCQAEFDLTPGHSLAWQVHLQPEHLPFDRLLGMSRMLEPSAPARDLKVPSRIVHLRLFWDDPALQLASTNT